VKDTLTCLAGGIAFLILGYQIISQVLKLTLIALVVSLLIKHLTVRHLVDTLVDDVALLVELRILVAVLV
jgi:hypothetical protein